MEKKEVPQDACLLGPWHEICYAVDEQGRYVLAPSAGWDPANLANLQAWEVIGEEIAAAIGRVVGGKTSPLDVHMARCQMDVSLLASYVGLARWRVRRHLRPAVFRRLKPALLARYADIFAVPPEMLGRIPDRAELPVSLQRFEKDQST
jgi:hypothetical protein